MSDVEFERNEVAHCLIFRLNRPDQLNAQSDEMQAGILKGLDELTADPDLRVGIITGAGRAFCVGADLKQMAQKNEENRDIEARFAAGEFTLADKLAAQREVGALARQPVRTMGTNPYSLCPKPLIAAINGPCVAGGMEIAMDCDIRIASTEAYFGLFEPKRGIMAGFGVNHLPRTMPVGEAMYFLLTADRMSPDQALRNGFVHEVLEPDALLPRAIEIATMISANAPLAVEGSKAMVQFWRHYALEESLRLFDAIRMPVLNSDDAKEGPRAFAEKREPRWSGT